MLRHWPCSVAVIWLLSAACYASEFVAEGEHPLEEEQQSTCAQKECARCDLATGRCLRCLYAIVEHTRRCTDLCPVGHVPTWRDDYDYQGTVCTPRSLLAAITGRDIAVIACAAAGGAVCVGIILGALIYARRHAALKPAPEESCASKIPVPRLWKDPRPSAADVSVSVEERKEFLQSLSGLRKDVPLLLEMLAETRARFRGLSGPENSMDTKARAYRAVVRDLSRVVSLVARRDDSFQSVPCDWRRLFEWADRVLTRYRRTRDSKCTGCQHHGTCELKLEEIPNKTESSAALSSSTGNTTQPLFQTRQQAQEARWRQQRQEAAKLATDPPTKLYWSDADFTSTSNSRTRGDGDQVEVTSDADPPSTEEPFASTQTDLEEDKTSNQLDVTQIPSVDVNDIEISYSKDEEALAHQKALFSLIDDTLKQDLKTINSSSDVAENKIKKERGSPGMITRIFCNRLINNSDISFPSNNDDPQKPFNNHNISKDIECLSSNSIYDHIEAFTFEDFSVPQKGEAKLASTKSKQKNTANVNIHRLRKPNFPGYSESFKQILDKKNLLNIQKNKIQKRFSKKGEQLNKIVRRTESRFLKDRNKMNPNLTYDRRNCKNDVVNETMVGGDVYVNVVKQPVVERRTVEETDTYKNFEDLEEDHEIAGGLHVQTAESEFTEIDIGDDKHTAANLRCEILTIV